MVKLDQNDVDNIRELLAFKESRINEIDEEIERMKTLLNEIDEEIAKLKKERFTLYKGFSYKQLGLKFDVTGDHIRQIKTGRCWGESCKEQ